MGKIEILGIGVDIESIDRFEKMINKNNKHFLEKIFTKKELKYCFSKTNPPQHLAARFAGKEAIFKAINNIVNAEINYRNIEIVNEQSGFPKVAIKHKKRSNIQIKVSLSHSDNNAIAFAIAMRHSG